MKFLFIVILTALSVIGHSQDLRRTLKAIKTEEQARQFAKTNADATVNTWLAANDTSAVLRKLFTSEQGDILTIGAYTCKIIDTKTETVFKVKYIYLDANKLSLKIIDSLRKVIIDKYHNGTSFADLVSQYTMDGNPTGDFGWVTAEQTAEEFAEAVKAHKQGDIFTIDVPQNKWYYVTLKTNEDQLSRLVTLLRVKNGD
jgi:parvulin-like peptidyl-prolyl isomerase